jgi:hypothetical protein
MMRRSSILMATFALGALALFGCGGGGTPDTDPTPSPSPTPTPTPAPGRNLRTTLAGNGTGSGPTMTTKLWRLKSLRPNGFFSGTGADQACPVSIARKDGSGNVSCGGAAYVTFFSNETMSDATSGPETNGTWTLSGSTLTTTLGTGAERVVSVYALTDEGANEFGGRYLRFRVTSKTESGTGTQDPEEVGNEFVLEEQTGI